METRNTILKLRKHLNLSQNEFAEKLSVTRQAVSRWENGETVPNIDTLKLIAETFDVSVDFLLGCAIGQCQSCGMLLVKSGDKGTESDGRKSEEYCVFCYQHGQFTQDISIEELIERNLQDLDSWNQENGLHLTEQEARAELQKFLPTLKRWRTKDGEEEK
ncbi:helix-turn-helix domain-containing protein [Clostridiaceae bacterium]|jgi:transcriptional regulator with XRE-family HTH domain|nr:helix-turn-helix domain-containing protein [Clostridiaceae bacterium]